MKPKVMVFSDWYLPGTKGGGAVSAVSNLIELLGDEFLLYVITRDRDNAENRPYENISREQWTEVGRARVLYTSRITFRNLRRRICEVDPQIIYLNSFFSRLTVKTLLLRKWGLLPAAGVVLAPRGEFSPAALGLKGSRKSFYRKVAFATGLCQGILWQASSRLEQEQIGAMTLCSGSWGSGNVLLAPDVPSPSLLTAPPTALRPAKAPGAAQFVFLSRVSRIKNLHFALEILCSVGGGIQLDIYGPIDDRAYWEVCREQMRRLPNSVRVSYKGPVPPEQVSGVFARYHFHLLPTQGENFGYVILESLAAACPVVISDQTPWRDLEGHGVGWALPLDDAGRWRDAFEDCVAMDAEAYAAMSASARQYAREWILSTRFEEEHRHLFQRAIRGPLAAGHGEKKPLPSA